jgi:transient receptor potential cation channel subfamily V member 6
MLGDFDLDAYTETSFKYISVSLLVFYIIVVTILLLNLLIAMMGDTYADVKKSAKKLWFV